MRKIKKIGCQNLQEGKMCENNCEILYKILKNKNKKK